MLRLVNASLAALDGSFDGLYAKTGRPSIAPERLLRAVLLQMLYSIRSERQLMERLEFDLLFRWFVGLGIDDAVWHPTVFTHNRDRVLTTEVAQGFLSALLAQAAVKKLLSAEHFSVDGTMLKAFASMKSFRAKEAQVATMASHRRAGAMASVISARRSARTRRTPRPPTRTPGFTARARARRADWPIWGMR
jgi:transposase